MLTTVTIPAGPVDDLSLIDGKTLTPFGPIETSDLHLYSSISVGTDMVITFSARKSDLTNYEKFWIEVIKHNPDGDVTCLYGADQAEPLSDLNPNGTLASTWKARFTHIYAKEMGLDVDARLCAQDAGGQIYVSPVRSANIRDYLGERLTATNNKVEQRVLAADLLNYGAAAQMFTDFETDHLVNEELTAEQLAKLHEYETTVLPPVEKTNYNTRPEGQSNIRTWSVEAYVGEIRTEGIALKVAMGNALLTYGDSAAAYFAAQ